MAEEVDFHKQQNVSDLDLKYDKYRSVTCHIQDSLDAVKWVAYYENRGEQQL